jgi:hypothetical protein
VIDSLEFQTKSLRNILKYVVPKPLGNIGESSGSCCCSGVR